MITKCWQHLPLSIKPSKQTLVKKTARIGKMASLGIYSIIRSAKRRIIDTFTIIEWIDSLCVMQLFLVKYHITYNCQLPIWWKVLHSLSIFVYWLNTFFCPYADSLLPILVKQIYNVGSSGCFLLIIDSKSLLMIQ